MALGSFAIAEFHAALSFASHISSQSPPGYSGYRERTTRLGDICLLHTLLAVSCAEWPVTQRTRRNSLVIYSYERRGNC